MLGLGVSLDCVRVAGGVAAVVAGVGGVGVKTVLVFGQVTALFRLKITHITEIITAQRVQNKIVFSLHMFEYFILLSCLMGAVGAVVAGKLMDCHLVSVDDGILLCFECTAFKITVNILIFLQMDVLDMLLQGAPVFGLIFALITRKPDVLVFCFVMLLEAGPVATLVITLITLIKYSCKNIIKKIFVQSTFLTFMNAVRVILERLRAFEREVTLVAHVSEP